MAFDDDDDIEVVDGPQAVMEEESSAAATAGLGGGDDEELAVVGRTGANSLGDYPHPRHVCPSKPFVKGGSVTQNTPVCVQCYCYVCDLKADECDFWEAHCGAWNGSHWLAMRQAKKKGGAAYGSKHGGRSSGGEKRALLSRSKTAGFE
jgi:hypothetical protein